MNLLLLLSLLKFYKKTPHLIKEGRWNAIEEALSFSELFVHTGRCLFLFFLRFFGNKTLGCE